MGVTKRPTGASCCLKIGRSATAKGPAADLRDSVPGILDCKEKIG